MITSGEVNKYTCIGKMREEGRGGRSSIDKCVCGRDRKEEELTNVCE